MEGSESEKYTMGELGMEKFDSRKTTLAIADPLLMLVELERSVEKQE